MAVVPLQDSEIPIAILSGCKTPAPLIIRVILTGILSFIMYAVIESVTESVLKKVHITFPIVAMVLACAAVYIAVTPTFTFLTDNLRHCSPYHRFKRLFRDEFSRKGVTREAALALAERRLDMERQMRRMHGSRRIGVQQNIGNGTSLNFQSGYY